MEENTGVRSEVIEFFGGASKRNMAAWNAGVAFGGAKVFEDMWDAANIARRLKDQNYVPVAGKHDVDPWNPSQGFYGLGWGDEPALALGDAGFVKRFSQRELPAAPRIDADELDYLIAKGSRYPRPAGGYEPRTEEERRIGLYWAYDGTRLIGTPPVLYNKFIVAVAQSDNLDIPSAARLLALCNLAMADAAIVAWEAKWRIALWRPVRAIQALCDGAWQPYGSPRSNPVQPDSVIIRVSDAADTLLGASPSTGASPDPKYAAAAFTPNFPSYPSGHATFGGACFQTLLNVRGEEKDFPNNVNVTIRSEELDPATIDNYTVTPRPEGFTTFRRILQTDLGAAGYDTDTMSGGNDASRVFLGVHWRFDQKDGDRVGRKIGSLIYGKAYPLT